MNASIYLGLSILEISNQFWYNYVNSKYGAKIKLHGYWELYSVHKNTEDIYWNIGKHVETKLRTQIMN